MKPSIPSSANVLGDVRAEFDHKMLQTAFYDSPDYRSLLESADRTVIVGRRGTGTSALFYQLKRQWEKSEHTKVITIAPEDYETISLQGILSPFKSRINLVRSAAKLAWRYALLLEIGVNIRSHYKFNQVPGTQILLAAIREWGRSSATVPAKMRAKIEPFLTGEKSPELLIGDLARNLQLTEITNELTICLQELGVSIRILIDRLDEGYESEEVGIGLIDGFLHASIEINNALPNTKSFMFLRDNIFRTIAKYDADYSRQIEGQVIRLHWDEYHLLNMVANRLRIAFKSTEESSIAVWNKFTGRSISEKTGFRECLRLTLYRPRDLISLLNSAFYHAFQHGRGEIIDQDIEISAKEISESRYADLLKEYDAIFPGISRLTRVFTNCSAEWNLTKILKQIDEVFLASDLTSEESQQFRILGSPESGVQALYSVGFIGIKDEQSGRYRFCHDGNLVKLPTTDKSTFIIHPCYWRALNICHAGMTQEEAEEIGSPLIEIRDEYDIEVSSRTPEIRKHRIGQIIASLHSIPEGEKGVAEFEQWCCNTLSIIFAAGLSNVELRTYSGNADQRIIAGFNKATTEVWQHILKRFNVKKVYFGVRNQSEIWRAQYEQVLSQLEGENGKLAFIITRDKDEAVRKDSELAWMKEIYLSSKVIIIKLTASWMEKYLSKARNPQKHDAADIALTGLLNRYLKNYLAGVGIAESPKVLVNNLQRDLATFVEQVRGAAGDRSFRKWAGDERCTLAIVFTDIVGSTALGENLKDEKMNDVRRAHFKESRMLINRFGGREIKTIGDSFMTAFRSVEKALDYAIAIQTNPGHPLVKLRAGIHIGPMDVEENDVFGTTINFAARVVGAIHGSEIWLSSQAKGHLDTCGARRHTQLKWARHDNLELKGFGERFCLWSLAK